MTPGTAEGPMATFGPYRTVSILGSGATGTVYDAIDEREGRSVALKVLHAERASKTVALARFAREARAASRLEHPHVVRVLDVGVDDPWIALERVEGPDLADTLRTGGRSRSSVSSRSPCPSSMRSRTPTTRGSCIAI